MMARSLVNCEKEEVAKKRSGSGAVVPVLLGLQAPRITSAVKF